MNIALIGYGKMGKTIERLATEAGHHIVLRISHDNMEAFTTENLRHAHIAIEFTQPDAAAGNVRKCLDAGVPVVCGTTGWNDGVASMRDYCREAGGAFLYASNFSIGVNIFFEINRHLAKLMTAQPAYDVVMSEAHHTEKKDAPSGTAVTLAGQILEAVPRKLAWKLKEETTAETDLLITAIRSEGVAGDHTVTWTSAEDTIEIRHSASNREGFARGAIKAGEFLAGKKGVFSMADVLQW
jgi:4-hydroxy-tetrahydrodipicolinate reductase